jgi:outer membrane protein OmpA-like peptidoglycan-associated protein
MKQLLIIMLLLVAGIGEVCGQNVQPVGFNAYSLRMLMIDHRADVENRDLQKSYGIELAYRRQISRVLAVGVPLRVGNADVGEFTNPSFFSADLLLQYYPWGNDGRIAPALKLGLGFVTETDRKSYQALPLGLDLNFRLGRNMWLTTMAEYRLANREERDNLVLGLGYVFRTGKVLADRDGDGVPDVKDRCIDVPGKATANGCPDADGDGVSDELDECPSQAGPADLLGCPDYDKDGLPDHKDQCPYEAGKKRLKGCPDIDNDGVPDDIDQCPNTPGSLYSGCPDTDQDGFEDNVDDCPDVAGPNRGCPEIGIAIQEQLAKATNQVTFPARDARIDERGYPALNDLAAVMVANPSYQLTVEGHTDDGSTYENNQRLSELRALAVRGYLIARGVNGTRIKTIGYGAERPRADNGTAVGRELNRRVVFAMVPR